MKELIEKASRELKDKDEQIRLELEKQGWQQAGMEFPFMTPLNSETGRFDPVRVLTNDQMKQKYIKRYGSQGFDEIKLEPSHKHAFGEDRVDESKIYVYIRKSKGDEK